MTTQHTPGPWTVRGDTKVISQAKGWAGREVANCMTYDATIAQRTSNARLIAASPDLLAALDAMLAAYDIGQDATGTSAIGLARAARNKARGEQ